MTKIIPFDKIKAGSKLHNALMKESVDYLKSLPSTQKLIEDIKNKRDDEQ